MLRRHKLASPFSRDEDYVFATVRGGPLHYRNTAARALAKAVERAGLDKSTTFHILRHSFASHLTLDLKLDVVQVSRQLGHANPTLTLNVYAHLFDAARHADDIRQRMAESAFGAILEGSPS